MKSKSLRNINLHHIGPFILTFISDFKKNDLNNPTKLFTDVPFVNTYSNQFVLLKKDTINKPESDIFYILLHPEPEFGLKIICPTVPI